MAALAGSTSVVEPTGFDQAQFEALIRDGYRLTPATMAYKITRGAWIPARHLMHISTIISTAIVKGNAHIIVTMPPRHGKTEFLSVNTPIWYLDKYPKDYIMLLSFGSELAIDNSYKVREAFLNEDNHDLLRTRLKKDRLKVDRFLTTEMGGVTAAGLGGVITGRGGNLILIDDYIKNAEESLSKGQRDKIYQWFKSTAYTRREPGASVIILATRWNQWDLIGQLLLDMPDRWTIINLPAIAIANDPLGRKVGEPLWPERYDLEELMAIKEALGNYWWMAMYQQDPPASMSSAELGEHIKIISANELPHLSNMKCVRTWDMAATEDGGDWTVGPKMYLENGTANIYITDMQRFQKSPGKTEIIVATCALGDGAGVPIWIEQEPGSAGVAFISHYTSDVLRGFNIRGERPTGPVEVRASPLMAGIEAGHIHMVRAKWNQAVIDEVNGFPDGNYDDIIVSLALGYHKLIRGRFGGIIWGGDRISSSPNIHMNDPNYRMKTGVVW